MVKKASFTRQCNFFVLDSDVDAIQSSINEHIPAAKIIHYRSTTSTPETSEDLFARWRGDTTWMYYLVRDSDLQHVRMTHIGSQGYWIPDSLRSPILEFSRGVHNVTTKELSRGRLYYESGFFNDNLWVEKTADFVSWATAIIRLVRKHLIKINGDYAGKAALTWKASDGGAFVSF